MFPTLSLGLLAPHAHDAAAAGVLAGMCFIWVLLGLAAMLLPVYCFWRTFEKAGLAPALSLLWLVPGLGIFIVPCILAFSDWPALRR